VQTFPAGIVEALGISAEMLVRELPCLLDVFSGKNFAGKIRLYNVLQSGYLRVIEKAAARANIGIDEARVRRVLPPMRELVAIGIEDRIEAKRLNRSLLEKVLVQVDVIANYAVEVLRASSSDVLRMTGIDRRDVWWRLVTTGPG
jgi:hypothetical protein